MGCETLIVDGFGCLKIDVPVKEMLIHKISAFQAYDASPVRQTITYGGVQQSEVVNPRIFWRLTFYFLLNKGCCQFRKYAQMG